MSNHTTLSRVRRTALAAIMTMVAVFAITSPARADLTASADQTIIPHYPDFVQDVNGQQAAVCVSNLGNPCGPDAASIADMTDPGPGGDAEAFYWSGAATADVGAGEVTIAFDVEVATVGAEPGITPVTPGDFQRIQIQGDAGLPNGTYTLVTPFGTFTATKTADNADGRWFRADTAGITTGPIDHFLTQVGAPTGFYGDVAAVAPTTDGATVSVYLPGHNPGDIDPVTLLPIPADGIATDWEIIGALVGNPITLPPADNDGDGVPDANDNCPAVAGPASNGGCPVVQQQPPATQPGTVIQVPTPQAAAQILSVPQAPTKQSGPTPPGRVTGLSIRNGVLRAKSPKGADVVTITVRKSGRFVRRITVNVDDNGQRFSRRLARSRGFYTAVVRAGNEQNDVVQFGASTTRQFRVR